MEEELDEIEPGWVCANFSVFPIIGDKKLSRYLEKEDMVVFSDIQSRTIEPFLTLLQETGILKDEQNISYLTNKISNGFKKFGDLEKGFKRTLGKKIDHFLENRVVPKRIFFLGDAVCGGPPYRKEFNPEEDYNPINDTFLTDLLVFNFIITISTKRRVYFILGNHDILFYFRVKEVLAALGKQIIITQENHEIIEKYQLYKKYKKALENVKNFVEQKAFLIHFTPSSGSLFTHSAIPETLINLLRSFFEKEKYVTPEILTHAVDGLNNEVRNFLKEEDVFSGVDYKDGLRRAGIFVRDFHAQSFPDDLVRSFSRWSDKAVARAIFNATTSGFHLPCKSQYDHRSLLILALFGGRVVYRGHDTFSIAQKMESRFKPRADFFKEAGVLVVGLHASDYLCAALIKENVGILVESISEKNVIDKTYYFMRKSMLEKVYDEKITEQHGLKNTKSLWT